MKKLMVVALLGVLILITSNVYSQYIEFVGFVSWPNMTAVEVQGDYAFCAFIDPSYMSSGMEVINISNPQLPSLVSLIEYNDWCEDICLSGDYAFLANGAYIRIINIANPANPFEVGSYLTANMGQAHAITVSGDYAYVADSDPGLVIINITDPINPFLAGNCDCFNDAENIALLNNYAYIPDADSGVKIINVVNPNNPFCESEWTRGTLGGYYFGIFTEGDYVYVTRMDGIFYVLDANDPIRLHTVGEYHNLSSPLKVLVSAQYAYITGLSGGFDVIGISHPENPIVLASYMMPPHNWEAAITDNYIYVANDSGLYVLHFNLTNIQDDHVLSLDFALSPNYPNPFNTQTIISYSLPRVGPVVLSIYNIMGQKVTTLIDGIKQPGEHQIVWDASTYPSGVYFARLEAGERSQNLKMMLLK